VAAELIEIGALPKTDIGDSEQVILFKESNGNDRIPATQSHTYHTECISSDGPHGLFVEPQALAEPGGKYKFVITVCRYHFDELVAFP
jgi:hypothetical protein